MTRWALLLLCSLGCATHPARTGRAPARAPDKDAISERVAGDIVGEMLEGEHGPYADPALASYVQKVGERVSKAADRSGLVWRFRVTDDAEVGASALPGGRVVISRATLAYLGSEAELAAVLGHEIAHVTRRHAASRLGIETPERPGDAGEHARRADGERQADELAVRYLEAAGYDPSAVARALDGLRRSEAIDCSRRTGRDCDPDDGSDPHPAWPARLARVSLAAGRSRGELGQGRYLSHIDGLVLGDSESAPRLVGGRFEANGGPSIALPAGSQTELSGGLLSGTSGGNNVVIVRAHGKFWRSMLLQALREAPHFQRDVAGFRTLVGSFGSRKDTERARAAVLEARPFIYLIAVDGQGKASEELLDQLLASVRPAPRASPELSRIRVVRARRAATLRRLCPATPEALAAALNGIAADSVVSAGGAVKCVEVSR